MIEGTNFNAYNTFSREPPNMFSQIPSWNRLAQFASSHSWSADSRAAQSGQQSYAAYYGGGQGGYNNFGMHPKYAANGANVPINTSLIPNAQNGNIVMLQPFVGGSGQLQTGGQVAIQPVSDQYAAYPGQWVRPAVAPAYSRAIATASAQANMNPSRISFVRTGSIGPNLDGQGIPAGNGQMNPTVSPFNSNAAGNFMSNSNAAAASNAQRGSYQSQKFSNARLQSRPSTASFQTIGKGLNPLAGTRKSNTAPSQPGNSVVENLLGIDLGIEFGNGTNS